MDSLEVNKAIASVLVAGIAFMVATLVADGLVHPERLAKPAIEIAMPAAPGAAPAATQEPPIGPLIAAANPHAGEQLAQKLCSVCHSFNEGGKAIVGPNLYNVVGGPHAHMAGFDYSTALKAKKGPWTYQELNEWLTKPSAYAPGTKMGFAGLASEKGRAELIDYLRTLSHNPEPLPPATAPQTATAAAPGAAAGGAQEPPIGPMIAAANPADGEKLVQRDCAICHSFNKGGKAIVGPNLYNVVGGPHAHMAGFDYSAALKAKKGPWTYQELNEWLTKPSAYAPGTKMGFAGLPHEHERAEVIAYLRTLSDNPEPLPAPAPAVAPAKPNDKGNAQAGTAGGGGAAPSQETPTEKAAGSTEPPPKQGGSPPAQ